jgi:hypothetical protein
MHGDFSRITFDRHNHYSRVLVQQGRVHVDADPNEQTAIVLHLIRQFNADLLGPHGVPNGAATQTGFRIEAAPAADGFTISRGHYYVDGVLCENERDDVTYAKQPDYLPPTLPIPAGEFLAYLDVWERYLTYTDRDLMREKALGGRDTAARAQVVWQVKLVPMNSFAVPADAQNPTKIAEVVQGRSGNRLPLLRARVRPGEVSHSPCIDDPTHGYRGPENQLYRVEVHDGGDAAHATFKWSRDNGSIVYPVKVLAGTTARVDNLGRDATRSLKPGDWVEALSDLTVLAGGPGVLAQVQSVQHASGEVKLQPTGTQTLPQSDPTIDRHLLLRRWDHRGDPDANGGLRVTESANGDPAWLNLEDGVQVQFKAAVPPAPSRVYVTGDYWLIPARVDSGAIEWPSNGTAHKEVPPHGVEHHYAPLATINAGTVTSRLRKILQVTLANEPA